MSTYTSKLRMNGREELEWKSHMLFHPRMAPWAMKKMLRTVCTTMVIIRSSSLSQASIEEGYPLSWCKGRWKETKEVAMKLRKNGLSDDIYWKLDNSRIFSTKSMYRWLERSCGVWVQMGYGSPTFLLRFKFSCGKPPRMLFSLEITWKKKAMAEWSPLFILW